jgi:hypothetical protein
MLTKAKKLIGNKLQAIDGDIGKVKQFYFDDNHWVVRYLVADTGGWPAGNQVLLSPYALQSIDNKTGKIGVNLTKKQIENGPPLTTDRPISQQFERAYYDYYGWPIYWGGMLAWSTSHTLMRNSEKWNIPHLEGKKWNPHLRSTEEVIGYHIEATDGDIGHVHDFIIDEETWSIRYLVVDTKNWWLGKKVLISPQWIERVSWTLKKVFINLSKDAIQQSAEYSEDFLLTRDYENDLYRHYGRQDYWSKGFKPIDYSF